MDCIFLEKVAKKLNWKFETAVVFVKKVEASVAASNAVMESHSHKLGG
jgi:hypothetical protein